MGRTEQEGDREGEDQGNVGQLQDLLQDLLVAVSLTEGVRLGLGLGPILPDAVANNLLLERTSPGTQLLFLLLLLFLNV